MSFYCTILLFLARTWLKVPAGHKMLSRLDVSHFFVGLAAQFVLSPVSFLMVLAAVTDGTTARADESCTNSTSWSTTFLAVHFLVYKGRRGY